MGKRITNNFDNRTIFPNEINVTEKRAPTDESVRLLNEMQNDALDNILCKISNEKNNEFKWEAYFVRVATLDFTPSGLLVIKAKINGKSRQRKIKVGNSIMSRISPGEFHYFDIDSGVRRYLFVQLCFLLGEMLTDDPESFTRVLEEIAMANITTFNPGSLAEIED